MLFCKILARFFTLAFYTHIHTLICAVSCWRMCMCVCDKYFLYTKVDIFTSMCIVVSANTVFCWNTSWLLNNLGCSHILLLHRHCNTHICIVHTCVFVNMAFVFLLFYSVYYLVIRFCSSSVAFVGCWYQ